MDNDSNMHALRWFIAYAEQYVGTVDHLEALAHLKLTCKEFSTLEYSKRQRGFMIGEFKGLFRCPHWKHENGVCDECRPKLNSLVFQNRKTIYNRALCIVELQKKRIEFQSRAEVHSKQMSDLKNASSAHAAHDDFIVHVANLFDGGIIDKARRKRLTKKADKFYFSHLKILMPLQGAEDDIRSRLHKTLAGNMKLLFKALPSRKRTEFGKWMIGQKIDIPVTYMHVLQYNHGSVTKERKNTTHAVETAFKIKKRISNVYLDRCYFD